jgi:hypothetical protein
VTEYERVRVTCEFYLTGRGLFAAIDRVHEFLAPSLLAQQGNVHGHIQFMSTGASVVSDKALKKADPPTREVFQALGWIP